jgi:hypothetical protein
MVRRIYTTMQGKPIDFDNIRLKNELVPAVGNMKVNARGDEITPDGNILKKRDDIVEQKVQSELKNIQKFEEEEFGGDLEITPEEAQKILSKGKKSKSQEK